MKSLVCPRCRARFRPEDAVEGGVAECPACGHVVAIPKEPPAEPRKEPPLPPVAVIVPQPSGSPRPEPPLLLWAFLLLAVVLPLLGVALPNQPMFDWIAAGLLCMLIAQSERIRRALVVLDPERVKP